MPTKTSKFADKCPNLPTKEHLDRQFSKTWGTLAAISATGWKGIYIRWPKKNETFLKCCQYNSSSGLMESATCRSFTGLEVA